MINPIIVMYHDPDDIGAFLVNSIQAAHGSSVRVFVRRHAKTEETVIVLLPDPGPSLAAALRECVQKNWSDDLQDRFSTPEQYLAGFGIVIPPSDEWASWSTSCPYCGTDGQLSVISGTFEAMGMTLSSDGFSTADAASFNTDSVQVVCGACQRAFSLDEVAL